MPAFVRDTSASVSASLGGSLTINDLGVLDLGYFYNDTGEGQDHVALSFAIPLELKPFQQNLSNREGCVVRELCVLKDVCVKSALCCLLKRG